MAVSAEEIYRGLSTSRKWLERALVVLAERQAFAGLMADELERIAGKVQAGVEITYKEMMTARTELRKWFYVTKLMQVALDTASARNAKAAIPAQDTRREPARPTVPVEPWWFADEPELVNGRKEYDPPRWINARFDQQCGRCGKSIERGLAALWFPSTRGGTCMCKPCGLAEETDQATRFAGHPDTW